MPRPQWTTAEQRSWLEDHKSRWLEATAAGETKTIRSQLIAEWYTAFPFEAPTPAEVEDAGGDSQKAEENKRLKTKAVRHLFSSSKLEADSP